MVLSAKGRNKAGMLAIIASLLSVCAVSLFLSLSPSPASFSSPSPSHQSLCTLALNCLLPNNLKD